MRKFIKRLNCGSKHRRGGDMIQSRQNYGLIYIQMARIAVHLQQILLDYFIIFCYFQPFSHILSLTIIPHNRIGPQLLAVVTC